MIVTYTDKGWEIITQRTHGLLAAQIASNWRVKDRSRRWLETVLAIAEHDDAQIELERDDLLTELGGPFNFDMRKFDLDHFKRTYEFSISKSRYIALLNLMHLQFVYGKEVKNDLGALKLMTRVSRDIRQFRGELDITANDAQKDYDLLEWCDALSLLICQHYIQPESRAVEISDGPDHKPYKLIHIEDNRLSVDPWPFETDSFEVYVESRTIPQLRFKDSEDFKKQFINADVSERIWHLEKHKAH